MSFIPRKKIKHRLKLVLLVFIAFYFMIGSSLYYLQEKLLFLPTVLEENFEYQFNHPFEELFLKTDDTAVINGLHFKAFVDTGAQISIMPEIIAEACNLQGLIDRKYKGVAKGVGSAEIRGRIHCVDVYLGTKVLPCGFTIINMEDNKLILGLDMLKSHGCILDFKNRCLMLGEERIEFVPGGDLGNLMDNVSYETSQPKFF